MVPYRTCKTCIHVVYPCPGISITGYIEACIWNRYTPEQEWFGVYMMIKSSRSIVFPCQETFFSYYSHLVHFSLSFDEEKDWNYMDYPRNWTLYNCRWLSRCGVYRLHGNGYSPRVWPCKWAQTTPILKICVHSQEKKTVECGNQYNVLFLMLHDKIESLVQINSSAFGYYVSKSGGRICLWWRNSQVNCHS